MVTTTAPRPTARQRLLNSAHELFYSEGIHTVGIDRIIEHAGVAKASLYNAFGSKDELVRAYLQERHAVMADRLAAAQGRWSTPRERLLGVFVVQAERMVQPDYYGCPFASATAESAPGSPAMQATAEYRTWLRGTFAALAVEAGVPDPDALAAALQMLYDGASLSMRLDGDRGAADAARAAAAVLFDAALAGAAASEPAVDEGAPLP